MVSNPRELTTLHYRVVRQSIEEFKEFKEFRVQNGDGRLQKASVAGEAGLFNVIRAPEASATISLILNS